MLMIATYQRFRILLLIAILFCGIVDLQAQTPKVISLKLDGAISPATASFIQSGIHKAEAENAACLIIHLNTPGGLLKSTRNIVGDLLKANVPVIVYVSPSGAHAGSAGVFITMAANIAAMAPATNIGAAHPVASNGSMDSIMNAKTTNDAAAFIRSIAAQRNRNFEWAEEAVRNSVSITAAEALEKNVIDLVAASENELLQKLDNRTVQINNNIVTLHTANALVESVDMSLWDRLLALISDPSVSYILLMAGIYGLLFELYSPGTMVGGVVGVICLILAFYSMNTLPVNYAGLALIGVALVLFILEIKITSYGLLSVAAIICLFLGSVMLFKDESALEFVRISKTVLYSTVGVTALFFGAMVVLAARSQKRKIESGAEAAVGGRAEVKEVLNPRGIVFFEGEIWNAISLTGDIEKGETVRVKYMKDLVLFVEKNC